ncbi:hypothetical protein HaLaN_07359, partial [Haematococcus lacustris]
MYPEGLQPLAAKLDDLHMDEGQELDYQRNDTGGA